ncbi:MAG TPA: hypothetical protein DCZ11_03725 [Gammaproteobacteria bacterium]|uniref:class I SAM-dependent methyltransferase n=1 Tax=Immundisolibacter sp. TaxID=1934948 RepID=UPI000E9C629C|nr:hypothetical protein [Gammaproteobacteria bacterium]HCZ48099.1 hypothetical protein [Gammaproteobacteria bacterium]MCH77537.1 hypothetical protein [Gammaproteobacteria bacterium]
MTADASLHDPLAATLAQAERKLLLGLLPSGLQGLVLQVPGPWPALPMDDVGGRAWSVVMAPAPGSGTALCGDLKAWPVASASAAVVILRHVLEQVDDPAPVLAEAERVLMPFGRLLVAGFNPWSLCGLRGLAERFGPHPRDWWPEHLRSVNELRHALSCLPMQVEDVTTAFFRLPLERRWALHHSQLMERIGPRLLPRAGGVYCLAASKRQFAVRPLRVQWQRKPVYARRPLRVPAGRMAA